MRSDVGRFFRFSLGMLRFELHPRLRFPASGPHNFGPGKADLLTEIERNGSIRTAAVAMSMSYQRAWNLVNEMNNLFSEPLVEMSRGGESGGGAQLTETGHKVLEYYRKMQQKCLEVTAPECEQLKKLLR